MELVLRDQADENRRILLDLKSILQGVQANINKEEDQKAKLHHQCSKDKHAWELERKKLNCRIKQLEEKKSKRCKERREAFGKEQCLLVTMDLKKHLEESEKNWSMEKMELLKCFDNERKEWESQLKDMQRKIEQIYWDVNSRQECKLHGQGQRKSRRDDWVPTDQGIEKNINNSLFIEELSLESYKKGGHGQNVGSTENDKNCSSALNAALQEIAKVSEELCSYQEEVQKKMSTIRPKPYPYLQACQEKSNGSELLINETSSDEKNHMSNDTFKAFQPILSRHQKRSEDLHSEINRNHFTWDKFEISAGPSGGNGVNDTSLTRGKAPPIPPRTSSLYLASTFLVFSQDHEDALKEGNSNCEIHSRVARKSCTGPHEAMLQKQGLKVLKDGRDFKTSAPFIGYDTGPKGSEDNCSQVSCDATDLVTESQYIGSKIQLSSNKSQVLPMQEKKQGKILRPRKSLPQKTNRIESNFPRSSKATEIFNTSSVHLWSAKDVPSGRDDSLNTLSTKSRDSDAFGKSVVQYATTPGQGSSIEIHSERNVHATRQLPLNIAVYAVKPHEPLSITSVKIDEPKHCHGLPCQMVDNDKRHMLDKADVISDHFSNPTHLRDAWLNFDFGHTTLRNDERSPNPSFQVKNEVACFADGTKQHTSFALHGNSNRISHPFQMVHPDQEKELKKQSQQSQGVSGQQLSLPMTLLPVTVRLNERSFSRPARPQNRRLPSRWATRSPAAHKWPSQKCNQAFRFDIKTSAI
ncbi:protein SOGA3a isoform X2 [Hemitrygon akajei]|uniref:protein SOGA3a isoform X2 n=1 Tax=Hemitrygon akajei TaxID=2704970 RepID=UPI003BF997F8